MPLLPPQLPVGSPNPAGDALGFIPTVQGKLAQLEKQIAGLRARLRYRYDKGVPASYVGEKVFRPETEEIDLDVLGTGDTAGNGEPINYVVRDGTEFSVPVVLQGPGVFMARFISVSFYQRYFDPDLGEAVRFPIPIGKSFFNVDADSTSDPTTFQTLKWHLFYNLGGYNELLTNRLLGINFFWNIQDPDSGRMYGDGWLPDVALLPQSYQNGADGDLKEFQGPAWLFERAGLVDFRFRLVNPILQLDPTATIFPFNGKDDRENDGTARDQRVTVRVELHGTKFYSDRDRLLREAV